MSELRTLLDARVPATMTADVHNFSTGDDIFVVFDNSTGAPLDLTGLTAGSQTDGCVRFLLNRGTSGVNLAGEDAGSIAANRFAWGGMLDAGQFRIAVYNSTLSRWEVYG